MPTVTLKKAVTILRVRHGELAHACATGEVKAERVYRERYRLLGWDVDLDSAREWRDREKRPLAFQDGETVEEYAARRGCKRESAVTARRRALKRGKG